MTLYDSFHCLSKIHKYRYNYNLYLYCESEVFILRGFQHDHDVIDCDDEEVSTPPTFSCVHVAKACVEATITTSNGSKVCI